MMCRFNQGSTKWDENHIPNIYSWCTRDIRFDGESYILKACRHQLDPCPYFSERETPNRYISKSTRYRVLDRQRWCCNTCGKHLKYSENHSLGDIVAHIDHIHPFSEWRTYKGYINDISNLEALCPDCNMKKHSKNGF